jgi:hypothetical protein
MFANKYNFFELKLDLEFNSIEFFISKLLLFSIKKLV